jgi:hypothetical protein
MTQPPVDPTGRGPAADANPTEPVPVYAPVTPPPGAAPAGALPPAPAPAGAVPPGLTFAPVEPEPGPGGAYTVPPAPATPPAGRRSGSSTVLTVAIAAAVLVGAVGIAYAAGRATSTATSPASDVTGGVSNRQQQGTGGGNQGGVPDQGGLGPMGGGTLPDASFDLEGNGGFPGDVDEDGDHAFPGRGLGRGGFGGLGVTGTVTAVDADSITIQTEGGQTVTIGLDGTTTYHQQAPAVASDVTTGDKVQVQLDGGVRPGQDSTGNINLGTAGDVTIVP